MAEPQGWVKIHRKILLNPVVCKDSDHFAVWMYLILEATHTDTPKIFNGEKITLHPGQLIRCLETISTKLHVSKSKVNRILKVLKSEKQIETLSKRHGTLFTLLNWSEYQANETQNETPVENQRKTNETPVERNKNVKNGKNDKNDKNKNNIPKNRIEEYTENEKLRNTLNEFVVMRKKIKSEMTDYALKLMLEKLDKLSGGSDILKVKILNQSIESSWKGIFELKEANNGKHNVAGNTETPIPDKYKNFYQ